MPDQMWSLAQFRFDEQIGATEVYVFDDAADEFVLRARDAAIEEAHRRGRNLVTSWPASDEDEVPFCITSKVTIPLRWERVGDVDDGNLDSFDERLWFQADCGDRDFLLEEGGHTFRGRLLAWCPHHQDSYHVSLEEMGEMSTEARYFVRGYLTGSEPSWPVDDEGQVDAADFAAWRMATRRFRSTGQWYGRWGTCSVCGCVLLPDSPSERCAEHS